MVVSGEKTVASVVVENIKASEVFMKYGIDFYCKGDIAIAKVCENLNITYSDLKKDLSEIDTVKDVFEDYNKWSLDFLVIYIENTHHTYIRKSLPDILKLSKKLNENEDTNGEKASKLHKMLIQMNEVILDHLDEEEGSLFPHIKKLIANLKDDNQSEYLYDIKIKHLINPLKDQRDLIAHLIKEIISLSKAYYAIDTSNETSKKLSLKLQEFELDLQRHFHLDNNILEPKAIQLENDLKER
ncbi:DUF542 domain-containing protein [Tenacibaculum xiamenense]|uniref:DUF542 domain-containing protein n=1 Tax=Tenacibaculum xiamenense TaxID=1261553 RepID=UPI003895C478